MQSKFVMNPIIVSVNIRCNVMKRWRGFAMLWKLHLMCTKFLPHFKSDDHHVKSAMTFFITVYCYVHRSESSSHFRSCNRAVFFFNSHHCMLLSASIIIALKRRWKVHCAGSAYYFLGTALAVYSVKTDAFLCPVGEKYSRGVVGVRRTRREDRSFHFALWTNGRTDGRADVVKHMCRVRQWAGWSGVEWGRVERG